MQELFDFMEMLSGALSTMEQQAAEKSAGAAEAGGKEELNDLIGKLRTAKSEVDQALAEEKQAVAEEEALLQRLAKPETSLQPPPSVEPPAPAEPEPDPKFGWKVRDRLLAEFVLAEQRPAPMPATRGAFESWIDASVSMTPDLFAGAPDDFARQVHQRAITLGDRESIWWACIAALHVSNRISANLPTEQLKQIGQASIWVAEVTPVDEEMATPRIPTGAIQTVGDAVAVAQAMASQRLPSGMRRPFEHPQEAAATAILLACKLVRRDLLPAIESEILDLGSEIAAGRRLWPSAGQRPSTSGFEGDWSSWMRESMG